jgi:hypothetical protein
VQLLNSTARSSPNFWSIARRDAIKCDFHESAQLSLIAELPVQIHRQSTKNGKCRHRERERDSEWDWDWDWEQTERETDPWIIFCGTIHLIRKICGTVHFYILWNGPFLHFVERSIFTFYMMSGTVEESTLQASGNMSLRNSIDGHISKNIDYVNQAQDKDKPYKTTSSWRPRVAEYKAICF